MFTGCNSQPVARFGRHWFASFLRSPLLMEGKCITIWIDTGKHTPKRAIFDRAGNRHLFGGETGVKRIYIGMRKPEPYSPTKMRSCIQINKRRSDRKNGPGLSLENESIWTGFRRRKK